MARTARTKAAAEQSAATVQNVAAGTEVQSAEAEVRAAKPAQETRFDLDPKQITSIINGNRVVLLRGGIKSIRVSAKAERSN